MVQGCVNNLDVTTFSAREMGIFLIFMIFGLFFVGSQLATDMYAPVGTPSAAHSAAALGN